MEVIKVVTALILDDQHRILVQQRGHGHPYPGYWETPGGKVEVGEGPVAALRRELWEELGLNEVEVIQRPLLSVGYSPPIGMGLYDVTLYRVVIPLGSVPQAMESQTRVEFCCIHEIAQPRVPSLNTLIAALETIYPLSHEG